MGHRGLWVDLGVSCGGSGHSLEALPSCAVPPGLQSSLFGKSSSVGSPWSPVIVGIVSGLHRKWRYPHWGGQGSCDVCQEGAETPRPTQTAGAPLTRGSIFNSLRYSSHTIQFTHLKHTIP